MTNLGKYNLKILALLLLSFAAAAGCFWILAAALQTGEIDRRHGRLLTAAGDPFRYWTYLCVMGVAGIGFAALGAAMVWSLFASRGEDSRIDRYLERQRLNRM